MSDDALINLDVVLQIDGTRLVIKIVRTLPFGFQETIASDFVDLTDVIQQVMRPGHDQ